MLYLEFLDVVPGIETTSAIWHLVRQCLVRSQQHDEEDGDDWEDVEDEYVLETFGDIFAILFGVCAEPQEVPVGEDEHNEVHHDIYYAEVKAIVDLDDTLHNRRKRA